MTMVSKGAESSMLLTVSRDIASMKTRGAGEIGKQAALALAASAKEFQGTDLERFRAQLLDAARLLAKARPTAVSLRNGLNFVVGPAMLSTEVAGAKKLVQARAEEFARSVAEAKAKIAKAGAALIGSDETILTHCHSTAALGVLVEAHRQGKSPHVFSTETRPFRQGLITGKALRDAGVDVTLIVDSAMLHVLEEKHVRRVIIGADAIDAQGGLYNKIGTRLLALAASSLKIPVYVCAETFKFSPYALEGESVEIEERDPAEVVSPKDLPGVKVYNPVFDRTPPQQITAYVTDAGLVKPKDVARFIQDQFGGQKRWI
jgi:ribose 1,5-bisphosphate isomerase